MYSSALKQCKILIKIFMCANFTWDLFLNKSIQVQVKFEFPSVGLLFQIVLLLLFHIYDGDTSHN